MLVLLLSSSEWDICVVQHFFAFVCASDVDPVTSSSDGWCVWEKWVISITKIFLIWSKGHNSNKLNHAAVGDALDVKEDNRGANWRNFSTVE